MALITYKSLIKYTLLIIVYSALLHPAVADILKLDDIDNADADTLQKDLSIFNNIGTSIALSIAECNNQDICDPTVSKDEINQLIDTLDQRILSVLWRQQDNAPEWEDIALAYISTKEKYTEYIAQLSHIKTPSDPFDSISLLGEDSNEDIFYDAEEHIQDDLGLIEAMHFEADADSQQ